MSAVLLLIGTIVSLAGLRFVGLGRMLPGLAALGVGLGLLALSIYETRSPNGGK